MSQISDLFSRLDIVTVCIDIRQTDRQTDEHVLACLLIFCYFNASLDRILLNIEIG